MKINYDKSILPMTNFTLDCFRKDQPNDTANPSAMLMTGMPELHAGKDVLFFLRMFARAYEPVSC